MGTEIKYDGYRLMVRREGSRVRCFTRRSSGWARRFPAIVEAALRIKAGSFLIDGEAVTIGEDGMPDCAAHAGAVTCCSTPSTCWSTMASTTDR